MTDKSNSTDPDIWSGCDVIGQTVRQLPVSLIPAECIDRAQRLVKQMAAVTALKEAQAQVRKALKQEQAQDLQAAQEEQDRLADAVRSSQEDRAIQCVILADYGKGLAYYMRTDLSTLVHQRALEEDEVQVQLAVPLRVVPNPKTGRLMRADGSSVDSLPFVRVDQCNPLICKVCETPHGRPHAADCSLKGMGDAAAVVRDQCDAQACLECDTALGDTHAEHCEHLTAAQ